MESTWKSPLLNFYGKDFTEGVNDGCLCAKNYGDQNAEYQALRHSVTITDNCHYGKFRVEGGSALDCVNKVVMADVSRLAIGRSVWTFMLADDGKIICDVYVVCTGEDYLVFSEGVEPHAVHQLLKESAEAHGAHVEELTSSIGLIGIDGPYSWELLKELVGVRILGLRYLEFLEKQPIGGAEVHVVRAGKSGEFGYQIIVPVEHVQAVWQQLLDTGKQFDVEPAGYDVQSLCRLENRFINIHREAAATKNPLELNCRVMIDQEKEDYNGEEALKQAMEGELEHRIIGLCLDGAEESTPQLDAKVMIGEQSLGRIVNAGFSPILGKPIALALLAADVAYVGLNLTVELASGTTSAKTVSAPFVFNKSMTVRPQEDSYHNR